MDTLSPLREGPARCRGYRALPGTGPGAWSGLLPSLLAAAALALPARGEPGGSAPDSIWLTESPLFSDRLDEPRNHFLIDGSQAFLSGREFYQARAAEPAFLWPSDPYLAYAPASAWRTETGRINVRAALGNEIGDAMFQELARPEAARDNRTPFTAAEASWSPLPAWRVHAGFDQNDHFSYRTLPARQAMVGDAQRDAMAWFGGNIPPRSAARAGIAFADGGGAAAFDFLQGWWWTVSPVSGQAYPWEGRSQAIDLGFGGWKLALREESWESRAQRDYYAARWNLGSVRLSTGTPDAAATGWKAEAGWEIRELRSDSAFAGFRRNGFPFALRYRHRLPATRSTALRLSGSVRSDREVLLLEHAAETEAGAGPLRAFQRLDTYFRTPLPGYSGPTEQVPGLGRAALREMPYARGFAAVAGLRHDAAGGFAGGIDAGWAGEWGAPVFRGAGLDTVEGIVLRAGAFGPGRHALWNGSLRAHARGGFSGRGGWRLEAGCRRFFGAEAGAMEFSPSRLWSLAAASWEFPSDLRAELRMHWLGPKEVRGWGPVFRIPAHFENDAGLAQALPGGHCLLRMSLLHAFGDEVREHPNGSPLRFRVLGSAEARF